MTRQSLEEAFDAQQVLTMAQRLSVFEIEALGEATELREAGLRAARSADLARAERLVREARLNCEGIAWSDEARTIFETYQQAAEAYVHYRNSQFGNAMSCTRFAIWHANHLRRSYDYVVEMRRVHLAANTIRINLMDRQYDEGIATGLALIRYLRGNALSWPWEDLALVNADILSNACRVFLVHQILNPLSIALAALHDPKIQASTTDAALDAIHGRQENDGIGPVIVQWVRAERERMQEVHS